MVESPEMMKIIAECGGIWKPSIVKGLTNPKSFFRWMSKNDNLIPLFRRYKGHGEWVYRLPKKVLEPYWHLVPKDINKYAIFRSSIEAYEYIVNGKPAIEWIMERYQVTRDKDSGIANDPNDWAREHKQPRYIVDLLKRMVRVSLETMKIVNALPALNETRTEKGA